MPEIFELYGSLKADTQDFTNALQRADARLVETSKNVTKTEDRVKSFGNTTNTQARNFEKLNERLGQSQARLNATAQAFQKGEASAKQMASALQAVDRASQQVNSRLRDTEARANDLRNKSSKSGSFLGFSATDVLSAGTLYAGYRALDAAIDKTKEAENANRALTASATEAGKSYSVLAKEAMQFGKDAAISNVEAQKASAELQRLLTLAGKPNEFGKYSQGFLDVAAARGVGFGELGTLFQGIIAGTDDALNRFGKQDPSKLAEQYAAQIGKTVEQLTEQEKIQSRLNAFQKDFELFSGKNAERLKETGGQTDQVARSISDLTTNLSLAATQSLEFQNTLSGLSEALKIIAGYDPIDIRIRLQAGADPKQLAQEAANSTFNQSLDWAGAIFKYPFANAAYLYDLPTKGFSEANRLWYEGVSPEASNRNRAQSYEEKFRAMQKGLQDQAQQAEIERQKQSPNTYLAWQKAQVEAYQKSAQKQEKIDDKAAKDYERKREQETEKLKRELEKRQQLLEDFNKYRASGQTDLIENPFERIAAEGRISANEAYNRFKDLGGNYSNQAAALENQKTQKRLQDELKNQLDNVRSLSYGASQNPFVQLFGNARAEIDKATEATKYLSKGIQDIVLQSARAKNAEGLFNLRADTALSALSYRQKADQILNPNRAVDEAQIIREQIYALQNANLSEDVRNRQLAKIFMSADPRNFPNEYRGFAFEKLNTEAQRQINEEAAGGKIFALLEKALKDGVPIKGAYAQFEIKDGTNAKVEKVGALTSPSRTDVVRAQGGGSSYYGQAYTGRRGNSFE